jgi:hypothetical protein
MSEILDPTPYQHSPPARTDGCQNSGGPGAVLTLVGGDLILFGTFLPWIGFDTDYTTAMSERAGDSQ